MKDSISYLKIKVLLLLNYVVLAIIGLSSCVQGVQDNCNFQDSMLEEKGIEGVYHAQCKKVSPYMALEKINEEEIEVFPLNSNKYVDFQSMKLFKLCTHVTRVWEKGGVERCFKFACPNCQQWNIGEQAQQCHKCFHNFSIPICFLPLLNPKISHSTFAFRVPFRSFVLPFKGAYIAEKKINPGKKETQINYLYRPIEKMSIAELEEFSLNDLCFDLEHIARGMDIVNNRGEETLKLNGLTKKQFANSLGMKDYQSHAKVFITELDHYPWEIFFPSLILYRITPKYSKEKGKSFSVNMVNTIYMLEIGFKGLLDNFLLLPQQYPSQLVLLGKLIDKEALEEQVATHTQQVHHRGSHEKRTVILDTAPSLIIKKIREGDKGLLPTTAHLL